MELMSIWRSNICVSAGLIDVFPPSSFEQIIKKVKKFQKISTNVHCSTNDMVVLSY